MKKLITTIILLCLFSCGTHKVIQKENNSIERLEQIKLKKDSIIKNTKTTNAKTEVSGEINKYSQISLQTADSIANKRINEALKNFKYSETSGKNKTKAYYDSKTMQLIIEAFVSKSENTIKEVENNQELETNTIKETTKEEAIKIDKYFYKKIKSMPLWVWIIVYFVFLDQKVVYILGNFIPQLKGAKTILSLFKNLI